jgi:hypothetical protein
LGQVAFDDHLDEIRILDTANQNSFHLDSVNVELVLRFRNRFVGDRRLVAGDERSEQSSRKETVSPTPKSQGGMGTS